MGNRAIIKIKTIDAGVYLHWNGGRDSVEAFLEYCKLRNFRCDDYGLARLCQIIGNFFGGSLSLGVYGTIDDGDAEFMDNGIYVVEDWEIVQRIPEDVVEQREYDKTEMLLEIDKCQPPRDQLGTEYILAPWVKTEDIRKGDSVYFREREGSTPIIRIVEGIAKHPHLDKPAPYVNRWGDTEEKYKTNINNYLTDKEYKVVR